MRYIIYGAGGIGSIMGGHLARTGHNVYLSVDRDTSMLLTTGDCVSSPRWKHMYCKYRRSPVRSG